MHDLILALAILAVIILPPLFCRGDEEQRTCSYCGGGGVEKFTGIDGDLTWRKCQPCNGSGWRKGRA